MAKPALFDTMAQEVAQTCDRRRSEAQQEADRIRMEGRQAVDRDYARGIETVQAEIEAADRRERQRLEAEADKARHAVQHRVVEEVLGEAQEEIGRIAAGEEFPRILEALLEEVLRATPGDDLVVLAPPAHADRIREKLETLGRGHLKVQPFGGLTDGVAVQDAKRTFRVSNTLSGRYSVIQNQARKLCLSRLFGEEG